MSAIVDLFRRDGDTSNTIIGIILLVMLLVFVGPNILPGLLARTFPFADEGVPCSRLRESENRAAHQSLIGRSAENPLSLSVSSSAIPEAGGELVVKITITNETVGTVPFVYDEDQVIVGDNGSSGVGLIFNPPGGLNTGHVRQTAGVVSFPENIIKLLGPRQRCVHTERFPAEQVDNTLRTGTATVQAYYRITSAGQVIQTDPVATPIYTDQGLAIIQGGIITSEAAIIPLAVSAGQNVVP